MLSKNTIRSHKQMSFNHLIPAEEGAETKWSKRELERGSEAFQQKSPLLPSQHLQCSRLFLLYAFIF